jgi:nucleoside-diphosphate-sugar epimerase
MKILVTAAGGFVGNSLIQHLIRRELDVTGFYRSHVSAEVKKLTIDAKLNLIQSDLKYPIDLDWQPDAIIHNAGLIYGGNRPALDFALSNILATKHVIDFAIDKEVDKFVYFSSLSALGNIKDAHVGSDTIVVSPGPYGLSKLYGENMLAEVCDLISSLSLRLPGIVGQGCHGAWLAGVAARAAKNEDIEIYNSNSPFNNVVHINDVCSFVSDVLEMMPKKFETVTLGTLDNLSVHEVVETIIRNSGSESKIINRGPRDGSFTIDTSSAVNNFGYKPMKLLDVLGTLIVDDPLSITP